MWEIVGSFIIRKETITYQILERHVKIPIRYLEDVIEHGNLPVVPCRGVSNFFWIKPA